MSEILRHEVPARSDTPVATMRSIRAVALLLVAAGVLAGAAHAADLAPQIHPDVIAAKVQARDADIFDFDVTVSSPYDTPQRYADGFRVAGTDGVVYGERQLLHDHASEQPFTRDLHGVKIPQPIRRVVLQARDRKFGYGGRTAELMLPGR